MAHMNMVRIGMLVQLLFGCVFGHGGLTIPVPRNNYGNINPADWSKHPGEKYHTGGPCAGDTCLWFNEGCFIGCESCTNEMPPGDGNTDGANYYGRPNASFCTPTAPTLPEQYRTWNINNVSNKGDFTNQHPWRSPGRAPVSDPCGLSGGYVVGPQAAPAAVGSERGDKGSDLPPVKGVNTVWFKGAVEEVGFMLGANHGGGYLYSVCPKTKNLTEACLLGNPLSFVGPNHTIRYLDGRAELQISATDVSVGTFPAGSVWRRNPIPACNCDRGFSCQNAKDTSKPVVQPDIAYFNGSQPAPKGFDCPTGTQFAVPFDYGYGQQVWNLEGPDKSGLAADTWQIVDNVRAPAAAGDYVLRWRWDTEQNPQIWTHCADITVV